MKRHKFIKASLALGATLSAPDLLARLGAQPVSTSVAAPPATTGVWSGKPLFFLSERAAALGKRIGSDPAVRSRWERFIEQADNLVAETHWQVGDSAGQASLILGLAWRLTGDGRYANKLRESQCGWPPDACQQQ